MKPEWQKDSGTYQAELNRARNKRHRESHKEQEYERVKNWRDENRAHYNSLMREIMANKRANMTEEEKAQQRERDRLRMQKRRAEQRALKGDTPKPVKTPRTHASKYPDPSAAVAEAVAEAGARTGVVILQGQDVDFATAWGYTDADLRAQVISQLPPTATEQELMDAYCALHYNRYGFEFDF